jgi:hypothetical protein
MNGIAKLSDVSDLAGSMICKMDLADLYTVDVTLENNTRLYGVGCTVIELRLEGGSHQGAREFMTADYAAHHDTYYENDWPGGAGIIGASALLIVAVWLVPVWIRRRERLVGA